MVALEAVVAALPVPPVSLLLWTPSAMSAFGWACTHEGMLRPIPPHRSHCMIRPPVCRVPAALRGNGAAPCCAVALLRDKNVTRSWRRLIQIRGHRHPAVAEAVVGSYWALDRDASLAPSEIEALSVRRLSALAHLVVAHESRPFGVQNTGLVVSFDVQGLQV